VNGLVRRLEFLRASGADGIIQRALAKRRFGGRDDMLIPIPMGAKHIAAVRGAVWKFVSCAHCQQPYAYLLELEATGEDYDVLFMDGERAAERALAQAEENLLDKSRNCVLPVPCPNCGFYQDEMSRQVKEQAWINPLQVAGAVIALLSLIPLAFDIAYIWVLTVVSALAGLTLLAYGYVVAFRFDPNAGDPEPRKAIGQRHAVWGEQLAELLATSASADPVAAPDRDGKVPGLSAGRRPS
jgi:hypothetical protein